MTWDRSKGSATLTSEYVLLPAYPQDGFDGLALVGGSVPSHPAKVL